MEYKCKECGSEVIIEPGKEPVRTCSCKKEDGTPSTIITNIDAVAQGKSRFLK